MVGLILLVALFAVAAPEVQVSTVDGRVINGDLQQLSQDQITIKTAREKEVTLPVDQLLEIQLLNAKVANPTDKPTAWIELVDGSKLTATEFSVQGNQATLTLESDKTATISTASIHKVKFTPPDKSSISTWPNDASEAQGDLLVVQKKGQIDFMEGSIGNIDENHVIIKVDGESYPVNRSKVDGLVYYHKATDKLPEPLCVVETSAGWRLKAKELSYVASNSTYPVGRFEAITVSGDKFFFLTGDEVSKIDFSAGKVAYLSDLEPASIQWTPYLDFGDAAPALADYYAPRRDEGREHQPLQLAGKKYDKGLSLYSRTVIDYRVPAGMKKFKATTGIDDAVREAGNVRLTISADGKKLFDQSITGKDAPAELDLDLAGAKRLSILVDYGDQFDAGDYLDLAEARMLK